MPFTRQQWKAIERASWIAGILSAVIALIVLTPTSKKPDDVEPPKKEEQAPAPKEAAALPEAVADGGIPDAIPKIQESEIVVDQGSPITPSPTPVRAKPTEIDDIALIGKSFGDMAESISTDKFIAPKEPHKINLRRQYKLEVADQSLSLYFKQIQVEGAEYWDATSPDQSGRRKEILEYQCTAPLNQMKPPMFTNNLISLNCAADKECWKCNRTTDRNFDPQEAKSDFPRNDWTVKTNDGDGRGELATKALQRLMTKTTSYK